MSENQTDNNRPLIVIIQDIITLIGLVGGTLIIIPFSILLAIIHIRDKQKFNFLSLLKLHIIFGYLLINCVIIFYIISLRNLSMIVRDFLDSIAQTATTGLVVLTYLNFKYTLVFKSHPKKVGCIALIIVYVPAIIYGIMILNTPNITLDGETHQFYLNRSTTIFVNVRSSPGKLLRRFS